MRFAHRYNLLVKKEFIKKGYNVDHFLFIQSFPVLPASLDSVPAYAAASPATDDRTEGRKITPRRPLQHSISRHSLCQGPALRVADLPKAAQESVTEGRLGLAIMTNYS